MFEYKVLNILPTKDGKYGFLDSVKTSSSVRTEYMENILNEYAKEGWRVISVTPTFCNMFGYTGGERLMITLERKLGE